MLAKLGYHSKKPHGGPPEWTPIIVGLPNWSNTKSPHQQNIYGVEPMQIQEPLDGQ
jgi:hypothetical protein